MYHNANSKVGITNCYSKPINVSVGVHQGSVLSSLLFIIVMEALSREFRIEYPWGLLYADGPESLNELKMRLKNWKVGLEVKGIKVNGGKIKVMCSRHNVPYTKITSEYKIPCGICWKCAGAKSILCLSCKKWVYKRRSGIRKSLRECEDFICKTCSTFVDDPFPTYITIDEDKFEAVREFCYLGDVIRQAGGYIDAVTARIRSAWKAFHELLPILTNRGISLLSRCIELKACVRSVLPYGSETRPM